jgi:nucleotide-binding universal stress UspA family protein
MTDPTSPQGGVMVGADGSDPGYVAVRFAACEAARLGMDLDVLHVLPAGFPEHPVAAPMVPEASLQAHAAEILDRAREVALETAPTLIVGTHLRSGSRIRQLLAFGEGARLMVLGNRSPRGVDRIWTGGTVTGVASRSGCPLIVVPEDQNESMARGRIAVGVKSPGDAREMLDAAFPLAAEVDAEIVVVHAWWLGGIYDGIIADRSISEQWQRDRSELIGKELLRYREAFSGVPVRVYVRHEDPAHALVRVTQGADRLLIQRPEPGRLPPHLGRVARAVLRHARCPVEVMPSQHGLGDRVP